MTRRAASRAERRSPRHGTRSRGRWPRRACSWDRGLHGGQSLRGDRTRAARSRGAARSPAETGTLECRACPRPAAGPLPPGLPDVETLFTFMRDAELRFETLRLRLEERTWVARDEAVRFHELLLQHPGRVRVTTIRPEDSTLTNHDVWLSDGEMIRTYRAGHRLGTFRPSRPRVAGPVG